MAKHLSRLNVRICQGVGGTFDVLAGKVKRAPRLARAMRLEWLYRLVTNPKRIARQTALLNFLVEVVGAVLKKRMKSRATPAADN